MFRSPDAGVDWKAESPEKAEIAAPGMLLPVEGEDGRET